jgi:sugar/nucleoside kinase (ribokinase family)
VSGSPTVPDYVLIGHVTCDVLNDGTTTIGGTASYSAVTAVALKHSVGIITSVNSDCDLSPLASVMDIIVKPAPVTTTFRNTYFGRARKQIVYQVAEKLLPTDLPEDWKSPTIAHLAPIYNECDLDFVKAFNKGTYIGITLQGLLRQKLPNGQVIPKLSIDIMDHLRTVSAVIVSEEDIEGDWEYAQLLAQSTPLLVVTCGYRGGFIYEHNKRMTFTAPQVSVTNPTGVGDIFAAAFFTFSAKGWHAYDAATFASCIASQSLTRSGLASAPSADDIQRCSLVTSKA